MLSIRSGKLKLEKRWNALRIQYEQVGMTQDAIEEFHDFDWQWFKSHCRYIESLTELSESTTLGCLPSCNVGCTGDRSLQYYRMSIDNLSDDFLNSDPYVVCAKWMIIIRKFVHIAKIALPTQNVNLNLHGFCKVSCYTPRHGAKEGGRAIEPIRTASGNIAYFMQDTICDS